MLHSKATGAGGVGSSSYTLDNIRFLDTPINYFSPIEDITNNNDGLEFKPDGTRMFIMSEGTPSYLYEYELNNPFDIKAASLVQYVSSIASSRVFRFKPDGTKIYILTGYGQGIYEYALSTAWDISTFTGITSFSALTEDSTMYGMAFKPDGTKMYLVGRTNDKVYEYTLSTAWDISTASFSQDFSIISQTSLAQALDFKSDGTKMYLSNANDDIYEYALSTAWDISTASYTDSTAIADSPVDTIKAMTFNPDGESVFFSEYGLVVKLDLSTAWDISTQSYSPPSTHFYYSGYDDNMYGMTFKPDGTKMYLVGYDSDKVYEFDLSSPWLLSTATLNDFKDISAEESVPRTLAFKPDGTKMYITGSSGDDINEYALSTAWDITTASFSQNFSVSAEDTSPTSLFFKPDGTKVYVAGTAGDDINEYNLSTAWDISTASYSQNFSVSAQTPSPGGLAFSDDGTVMLVSDVEYNRILEYGLSTAWDVTTASYVQAYKTFNETFWGPTSLYFLTGGGGLYLNSYTQGTLFYRL